MASVRDRLGVGWHAYRAAGDDKVLVFHTEREDVQIQVHVGTNDEHHEFKANVREATNLAARIVKALTNDQEVDA